MVCCLQCVKGGAVWSMWWWLSVEARGTNHTKYLRILYVLEQSFSVEKKTKNSCHLVPPVVSLWGMLDQDYGCVAPSTGKRLPSVISDNDSFSVWLKHHFLCVMFWKQYESHFNDQKQSIFMKWDTQQWIANIEKKEKLDEWWLPQISGGKNCCF